MPPHCAPPAWEEMLSPATYHASKHGWHFGGQHSHVLRHIVRCLMPPVTKNGRSPSAKREDAISNSEVHLSKIGPAQV